MEFQTLPLIQCYYIDCSKYKLNAAKSSLENLRFGLSLIFSLSARDEYGNTYPPYEGEYSILTLPVRESIEILPLSVRVSIGMFSAHIKEYGNTSPVS